MKEFLKRSWRFVRDTFIELAQLAPRLLVASFLIGCCLYSILDDPFLALWKLSMMFLIIAFIFRIWIKTVNDWFDLD